MKATRCLWSLPGQLFLDNSFAKPHALHQDIGFIPGST